MEDRIRSFFISRSENTSLRGISLAQSIYGSD